MSETRQKTRQLSPGIHRARRPKQGMRPRGKQLNILLTEEEKARIEQAAAVSGVSLSRFMMEWSLKAAKKILARAHPPARQPQRPSKSKS